MLAERHEKDVHVIRHHDERVKLISTAVESSQDIFDLSTQKNLTKDTGTATGIKPFLNATFEQTIVFAARIGIPGMWMVCSPEHSLFFKLGKF